MNLPVSEDLLLSTIDDSTTKAAGLLVTIIIGFFIWLGDIFGFSFKEKAPAENSVFFFAA